MEIKLKLIATYRELLPPGTQGNTITLEVAPGTTVGDLVAQYRVPLDDSSVILLNGLTVPYDQPVTDGDEVAAFSAVAGG